MKKNFFPVVCRFSVAVSFLVLCLLPLSFAVGQTSAPSPKAGDRMVLKIKGVDYAFRWCPAGSFMMGSPEEEERYDDETLHKVNLSKGFWMQETQVTQTMWKNVMGDNPSEFRGPQLPVENVSWDNCQEYVKKLNNLLAGTPGAPAGFKFSLPTEAQWEYACRAGTTTAYHVGDTLTPHLANINGNLRGTSNVGSYPANAWGLRGVHGNVHEWCLDLYAEYEVDPDGGVTDPNSATLDPDDPRSTGGDRVRRGGDYNADASRCRSASRSSGLSDSPKHNGELNGLRLALVASE